MRGRVLTSSPDINAKGAEETIAGVTAAGRRGLAVRCDVSDSANVDAMTAAAQNRLGHVDVLFNGAGILFPTSIMDTTAERWNRTFAGNLRGIFSP